MHGGNSSMAPGLIQRGKPPSYHRLFSSVTTVLIVLVSPPEVFAPEVSREASRVLSQRSCTRPVTSDPAAASGLGSMSFRENLSAPWHYVSNAQRAFCLFVWGGGGWEREGVGGGARATRAGVCQTCSCKPQKIQDRRSRN